MQTCVSTCANESRSCNINGSFIILEQSTPVVVVSGQVVIGYECSKNVEGDQTSVEDGGEEPIASLRPRRARNRRSA